MSAFADLCRFVPTAGGTTDWTYSSAVGGCQSPSAAGVQNGVSYKVYSVSADLTQWEVSAGLYNSSTGTFPRTTVLYNSSGTGTAAGQSGAGTKINFSTVPQVSIIAIAEDLIPQQVGQLPGTATNDNASAGNVGEFQSASLAIGSAIALTANTPANIVSLPLAAGDWEIQGDGYFTGGATTVGVYRCSSVSLVSATLDLTPPNFNIVPDYGSTPFASTTGNASGLGVFTPMIRKSFASPTTIYLVAQVNFSGSTMSAFGFLRARRPR